MRYLIDTNIFLFYIFNEQLLDSDVRNILENYENRIYISSESIKETIHLFQTEKVKTKKWRTAKDVFVTLKECHFTVKYIKEEHLEKLSILEQVERHNDPSDRLIIAQAITENLPLISSDRKFEQYRKHGLNFIYNHK